MRFLVIGGGGREHALAWRLAASCKCDKLFCLPGNGGTSLLGDKVENVDIRANDSQAIIDFATRENIDFAVIGPEQPLVDGLADDLRSAGIGVLGPSAQAAQLESSKAFAKQFCQKYNIPCAKSRTFSDADSAKAYIAVQGAPIVVKADGLAAGKGVVVADSVEEAQNAVDDMMAGAFGEAGKIIVIEECLQGQEISFFALCDGSKAIPLLGVKDHKRAFDNDEGPNTGGMGAYGWHGLVSEELQAEITERILQPTLRGMQESGHAYSGILFLGLMLCEDGVKLIEYNVRFGDPECQVMMMLLASDLGELLLAYHNNNLHDFDVQWNSQVALTIVMAAKGYPSSFDKGLEVGLASKHMACETPSLKIFHAATHKTK